MESSAEAGAPLDFDIFRGGIRCGKMYIMKKNLYMISKVTFVLQRGWQKAASRGRALKDGRIRRDNSGLYAC
jgi:hypothetical protein